MTWWKNKRRIERPQTYCLYKLVILQWMIPFVFLRSDSFKLFYASLTQLENLYGLWMVHRKIKWNISLPKISPQEQISPENRDSKGEPISAKDLAERRIRKVCVGIRWNLIRFNSLNCQNKPPMNEKSKLLLKLHFLCWNNWTGYCQIVSQSASTTREPRTRITSHASKRISPSPQKIRSNSRLFRSLETSRAWLQKRNQILW